MAKWGRQTVVSFFTHLVVLSLLCLHAALAQVKVERVRSFGLRELSGSAPHYDLLQASDGFLYGIASYNPFEDDGIPGGCIYRISTNGTGYTVLHVFTRETGYYPSAPLIEGPGGALYGVTAIGGSGDGGTVFKINKDGTGHTVLRSFPASPALNKSTGANPVSLILGTDGLLYGGARSGGDFTNGVAFKMRTDGANFSLLRHFGGIPESVTRGQWIGLIEGTDGFLYGVTSLGATNDGGSVFKLSTDGADYRVLHDFVYNSPDGYSPQASLIEASDGVLYGTTRQGLGSIFKINRDGSGFAVLHRFSAQSPGGYYPLSKLTEGGDGALYGTTAFGGASTNGVVFKLNKDGSGFATLHSFAPGALEGREPHAGVIEVADGRLCGTAIAGGQYNDGVLFALDKDGNNFTVLRHFIRDGGDGQTPYAALAEGADRTLYGTTYAGGASNLGAIFKVRADGSGYRLLHSFAGAPVGDGEKPWAGVVVAPNGTIYGTTSHGGDATDFGFGRRGHGTLFRLNPDGSGYTVLLRFATSGLGSVPTGITLASDGALYGISLSGIFRVMTNGTGGTLLHRFHLDPTDGRMAEAGSYVLEAGNGALYGTTTSGGTSNKGIIFKINKNGSDYQILHHFTGTQGGGDGATPSAGLFEASDGALYGTTRFGGAHQQGTVFRLSKEGSGYTIIHHFRGFPMESEDPFSAVVEASDGMLYGTLYGFNGYGVAFQLSKDGSRYSEFGLLGDLAYATMLRGSDGALYGTTSRGGSIDAGAIYKVSLAPALITQPQSITARKGDDVTFNAAAGGTPPFSYQWRWNATNLLGGPESSLALANVSRTNAGYYSLLISNAVGTAISSNALLRVLAPHRISSVQVSPPELSFQWTDDDGAPLSSADLPNFTVQKATSIPATNWITVTNPVAFTNGALRIQDPVDPTKPSVFYRVLEH